MGCGASSSAVPLNLLANDQLNKLHINHRENMFLNTPCAEFVDRLCANADENFSSTAEKSNGEIPLEQTDDANEEKVEQESFTQDQSEAVKRYCQ